MIRKIFSASSIKSSKHVRGVHFFLAHSFSIDAGLYAEKVTCNVYTSEPRSIGIKCFRWKTETSGCLQASAGSPHLFKCEAPRWDFCNTSVTAQLVGTFCLSYFIFV